LTENPNPRILKISCEDFTVDIGQLDFAFDNRLSLELIGLLAKATASNTIPSADWIRSNCSVGRDKAFKLLRDLERLGYLKTTRNRFGVIESRVVRTSLASSWTADDQAIVSRSEDLVEVRVDSVAIEAELIPDVIVPLSTRRKNSAVETAKQDDRFKTILAAYREMLKQINKRNNLGEVNAAAKAFAELSPRMDADQSLAETIVRSLQVYIKTCNGYPVRLARYLSEGLWAVQQQDGDSEDVPDWEEAV
jgi:hypothetical protein